VPSSSGGPAGANGVSIVWEAAAEIAGSAATGASCPIALDGLTAGGAAAPSEAGSTGPALGAPRGAGRIGTPSAGVRGPFGSRGGIATAGGIGIGWVCAATGAVARGTTGGRLVSGGTRSVGTRGGTTTTGGRAAGSGGGVGAAAR